MISIENAQMGDISPSSNDDLHTMKIECKKQHEIHSSEDYRRFIIRRAREKQNDTEARVTLRLHNQIVLIVIIS
uniref:Uncharacterized protein n=1 Tax=Trichogramma kaykai TaxID=54128 RepID=A0ABD2W4R0_9HYME